jgi:hypothetical protein
MPDCTNRCTKTSLTILIAVPIGALWTLKVKLALTSPKSGSHWVGTVCLWTKTAEFVFLFLCFLCESIS